MARGLWIDPHLRGRITPRIEAALIARGMTVHRIGAAAYVHDATHSIRFILAVLPRRTEQPPTWVDELQDHHTRLIGKGKPTPRRARAIARRVSEWSRARTRDRRGRFVGRPAWWQDNEGDPLPGFLRPWRVAP